MEVKQLLSCALAILVFCFSSLTSARYSNQLAEETSPKIRRQTRKQNPCGDSSWTAYKDKKCYKVLPVQGTADETLQLCIEAAEGDIYSPVISIHSAEEQSFLVKYIFETNSVTTNVWLGAKRVSTGYIFEWNDRTAYSDRLQYSNWETGAPSADVHYNCLQMGPSGQWKDAACGMKNTVVCSKRQWLTRSGQNPETLRLAQELSRVVPELDRIVTKCAKGHLELEQKLGICIEDLSKLGGKAQEGVSSKPEIEEDFEQCKNSVSQLREMTNEVSTDISHLQDNPVPIGFIYIQLPRQKEPSEIWPKVTWTQVTEDYAGLFFRAEGNGSNDFDEEQEADIPRVYYIQNGNFDGMTKSAKSKPGEYNSNSVFTGGDEGNKYAITFLINDVENRPKNTAIRIWSRTE